MNQLIPKENIARISFFTGVSLIFASVLFNIWLVEAYFVPDHHIEWPTPFILYFFQLLTFLAGLCLISVSIYRDLIIGYFINIGLQGAAFYIFIGLVLVDLLLLSLSFMARDSILYDVFCLDMEKNIPSTFSAVQLILAALAALYCMHVESKKHIGGTGRRLLWLATSAILIYMSFDEYFSFHEDAGVVLLKMNLLPADDMMLYGYGNAWTIVGAILAMIVGIALGFAFLKVFRNNLKLLFLLILSGFVFLFGAIGMENFQVFMHTYHAGESVFRFLMLEEFFEMFGVSLSVFVFLRYAGTVLRIS